MKKHVTEILRNINSLVDYDKEDKLISNEILDSIEFVELVSDLEEAFGMEIPPEEIVPDRFDSIDSIVKLIQKLRNNGE